MDPKELIKNLGFKRVESDFYGEEEEVYTISGKDDETHIITFLSEGLIEFYNTPFQFSEDLSGRWSMLENQDDDYMSITIGPKHYDKIPMIIEFWKDPKKAREYVISILKKRASGVEKVLTDFNETLEIFKYSCLGSVDLSNNSGKMELGLISYTSIDDFNIIGFEVNPLDLTLECIDSYNKQDLFKMDSGDFILFLYNFVFYDEDKECIYPDEVKIFNSL